MLFSDIKYHAGTRHINLSGDIKVQYDNSNINRNQGGQDMGQTVIDMLFAILKIDMQFLRIGPLCVAENIVDENDDDDGALCQWCMKGHFPMLHNIFPSRDFVGKSEQFYLLHLQSSTGLQTK